MRQRGKHRFINEVSTLGNLEQEIAERIANLRRQELQSDVSTQLAQQRLAQKEQRHTLEQARIAALGMEVVSLLQKHGVRPRPLWKLEVVDRHVVRHEGKLGAFNVEEGKKEYVSAGQGWKVYERQFRGHDFDTAKIVVGIDERGRPFEFANKLPGWSSDDPLKRMRPGWCIERYIGESTEERELAEYASINTGEAELASDIFRNGVASLIGGMGVLKEFAGQG